MEEAVARGSPPKLKPPVIGIQCATSAICPDGVYELRLWRPGNRDPESHPFDSNHPWKATVTAGTYKYQVWHHILAKPVTEVAEVTLYGYLGVAEAIRVQSAGYDGPEIPIDAGPCIRTFTPPPNSDRLELRFKETPRDGRIIARVLVDGQWTEYPYKGEAIMLTLGSDVLEEEVWVEIWDVSTTPAVHWLNDEFQLVYGQGGYREYTVSAPPPGERYRVTNAPEPETSRWSERVLAQAEPNLPSETEEPTTTPPDLTPPTAVTALVITRGTLPEMVGQVNRQLAEEEVEEIEAAVKSKDWAKVQDRGQAFLRIYTGDDFADLRARAQAALNTAESGQRLAAERTQRPSGKVPVLVPVPVTVSWPKFLHVGAGGVVTANAQHASGFGVLEVEGDFTIAGQPNVLRVGGYVGYGYHNSLIGSGHLGAAWAITPSHYLAFEVSGNAISESLGSQGGPYGLDQFVSLGIGYEYWLFGQHPIRLMLGPAFGWRQWSPDFDNPLVTDESRYFGGAGRIVISW
ncbi:MAG: hypothetical protein WC480_02405 [Patescibacteria group bacterium]